MHSPTSAGFCLLTRLFAVCAGIVVLQFDVCGAEVLKWRYEVPASGIVDGVDRFIRLTVPPNMVARPVQLTTASGENLAWQFDLGRNDQILLRIPPRSVLARGGPVLLSATEKFTPQTSPFTFNTNDHRIEIAPHGNGWAAFQTFPGKLPRADVKPIFTRGGYLHPLKTPSGRRVTDDFPPNHVHHHGIWFAWTKTEFEGRHPDFWNMGDGKGTVEFKSLDLMTHASIFAGFRTSQRYHDLSVTPSRPALDERWSVFFYAPTPGSEVHVLEIAVHQSCFGSSPLKLPEYRYGGIGIRGNQSWDGAANAQFLTSNGEGDRVKAHATRVQWCYMGGNVDGSLAGLAVLAHPSNFRAPEPVRVHPTEPFLNFAPSQAGDFEIVPGQVHSVRYRILLFDGTPRKALLDAAWADFALPALIPEPQNP